MCQSNGKEVEKNRRDGFGAGLCANRFNKHRSVAGAQLHHFTASTTAVSILLGGRVATRDNNTTSSSGILRSLSCSAPSSSFLCSCIDTHRHPSDGTTPAFENRSKCFLLVSLFLNQRFPLPHPCSQTLGVLRVWESLAFFFYLYICLLRELRRVRELVDAFQTRFLRERVRALKRPSVSAYGWGVGGTGLTFSKRV